jgi:hypothetical protein
MSFNCSKCGTVVTFGTITFDAHGNPNANYCRPCRPKSVASTPDVAKNMWGDGFKLDHVKDETGRNVVIHSTKDLREKEKRYGFSLACMSEDDISRPPQNESWAGDISHGYEKKFNRDPAAYANVDASVAGVAKSADDTLASRPNPV